MTTSPDSVSYPDEGYGVLGPLPALLVNVQDFGADPTGNDDSTLAIQAALDAAANADGGEVVVPPGTYKITDTLLIDPNTVLAGSGKIKGSLAEWVGPRYRAISNRNWEADDITDENIVIRGVTFDWTDIGQTGSPHIIYIRRARNVVTSGITTYGGASAVAFLGCDNTLEQGNNYYNFYNCGSDHWDNPRNARVIGCYIETTQSSQMVNFNPEPSATPYPSGQVASGFVMSSCTLVSSEANATPCQIEPLAAGNYVEDVTITGNTFVNSWLVLRGDVRRATVSGNAMSGFSGTQGVILCSDQFATPGTGLAITGNSIADALTASPSTGVIVMETNDGIVAGNIIMGTAYSAAGIYTQTYTPNVYGNWIEKQPQATNGFMQQGFRLLNGADNYIGWLDTAGNSSRMYVTNANSFMFTTRDASGALRTVASINARSDTSAYSYQVPLRSSNLFYQSQANGLTATGSGSGSALVLAANVNQVATVALNTGVRLPNQSFYGGDITVINDGANSLSVYPTTGGTIDSLAVNVAYSLPAGSVGVWTYASGTNWRTKSIAP